MSTDFDLRTWEIVALWGSHAVVFLRPRNSDVERGGNSLEH